MELPSEVASFSSFHFFLSVNLAHLVIIMIIIVICVLAKVLLP